jgi:HK97 family phage portal protein
VRLFGLEIRRAEVPVEERSFSHVPGSGGWVPLIHEPFTGAWQRNRELRPDTVLSHPTVFAGINLIASDIAKMRTKLVELAHKPDLWVETDSPAFSPVLRRPNHYQTAPQFKKMWITSKIVHGNVYVLLERDGRGVVNKMHILDPNRVRPAVAPDGEVVYQLSEDALSGITADMALDAIPASEIIHDRMNCLFHPLVGISPLYAAGGPAGVGLTLQHNADAFFGNGSNPSGALTAPASIPQATVARLRDEWRHLFSGGNSGNVAVLGDGLKWEPLRMTSTDAQMMEHLKWTAESVAAALRIPAFMLGAAPVPALNNTEVLTRIYYSTCLHEYVHDMETTLDAGLGMEDNIEGRRLGIELDKTALLQMDTATQYETLAKGIRGGFMTPNEARALVDLEPLTGGDTVYLQHQDYPIEALYDRTLEEKPAELPPAQQPPALPPSNDPDRAERAAKVGMRTRTFRLKVAA